MSAVSAAYAQDLKLFSAKELGENAYLNAGADSKGVGANLGYVTDKGWIVGMDLGFKMNEYQEKKAALNVVEANRTETKVGMSPAVLLGIGYKF